MGTRSSFVIIALITALAVGGPPWLALHEARRQAYELEAGQALGYARDILHRAGEADTQALDAIKIVSRTPLPPCSPPMAALMRDIDLSFSYIQAIGHVRDGVMECSSIGGPPVALGPVTYRSLEGITIYGNVSLTPGQSAPFFGVARDDVVVLLHRDLPLDIWTSAPNVALAVVQLRNHHVFMARGHVATSWHARLGQRNETSFIDGDALVAIVRARRYPTIAAIVAVPIAGLHERVADMTRKLLPAGLFCGLAAAVAIVLLARRQMSLASALRQGLRRHEFYLLYQPLVDLRSGRWTGVEALLRWRRPSGEPIGPNVFIPIAEQTGLITRLTERVLELVEVDMGRYLASHPDFHVGINLAPADLASPTLVERIDGLLSRSGARGQNLIVEITERGFLDLDAARTTIASLRARGIQVAIDDFGTGYSSLSYLETLDLDYLKIDRSFIEVIGSGAPTSQVVCHIIAMARSLDLSMIGEGIESAAQLNFLQSQQVQYGQGMLLGEPMPFTNVMQSLRLQTDRDLNAANTASHIG